MKNLKKVVLGGFALVAVVAISFINSNIQTSVANNSQDEVSATNVQYASVIDWSNYDFNSSTEAEKCGAGKCGDDKKKAETKKDAKKCGGDKAEKKCGTGKCGGDKAKKSDKKSADKKAKCGTGKCGKA